MGTLAGFVVGFLVGARSGPESVQQIVKAWEAISSSEEFLGMRAMALGYLQSLLAQGGGELGDQLRSLLAGQIDLAKANGHGDHGLIAAWSKISASEEFRALLASGTAMLGGMLAQGAAAFPPRSH